MSNHRVRPRPAGTIALIGLVCAVSAFTAATAAARPPARPPSHYRNWAQTPGNGAGVVFHPHGDVFEIWHNRSGDSPVVVAVEYNYKGVRDRWKTAVRQIVIGRTHFRARHNRLERRHIFFRIHAPDRSPYPSIGQAGAERAQPAPTRAGETTA